MTTMAEQVEDAQEEFEEEAREEEDEEAEAAEEEPETEPEPEPEGHAIGPDELRKAERAIEAQRKKLSGILGAEYVAHDCMLCAGVGFVPELPPIGSVFTIGEGDDGPVLIAEAPPSEDSLAFAPDKEGCPECLAEGFVRTGSKNPNARVAPCSKCQGNGWIQKLREQPAPQFVTTPPPTYATAAPPAMTGVGPDAWGRAEGHPHWGVPPANIPG